MRPTEDRTRPRQVLFTVDAHGVALLLVAIVSAWVIVSLFRAAPSSLAKIFVGVLIGMALDPVVLATRRRLRCSRATATLLVLSLASLAFAAIVITLAPRAIEQGEQLTTELPQTVEEFYSWPVIGNSLEKADAVGHVESYISQLPDRLTGEALVGFTERVIGSIETLLIVFVAAAGVLLDGDALVARVRRLVPVHRRAHADEIGRIVYRSIGKYFAGSLVVATINGFVVLATGLALGVPLTPLAAIWCSITNLIPQVGGFLGGSFFVTLAFTKGPVEGVIALIVFLVYQQVENSVVQPAIVGRAVDLSPPTTMVATLIGGAAAGLPGALAATPLLSAAKSVLRDLNQRREAKPDTQAGENPETDESL